MAVKIAEVVARGVGRRVSGAGIELVVVRPEAGSGDQRNVHQGGNRGGSICQEEHGLRGWQAGWGGCSDGPDSAPIVYIHHEVVSLAG